MKTTKILSTGEVIPSRCYYYLLDFNEVDKKEKFNELHPSYESLSQLTAKEFWALYKIAVEQDLAQEVAKLQKKA